jgi:hypothetical protein
MTKLKRYILASALGLSAGTAPCLHSQTFATVTGRVYDAGTNAPLPGVPVSSVSAPARGGPPLVALTRSNDDGTYTLNVAPGERVICADAGRLYLDPCRSSINGAQGAYLDLPLQRGVLLIVRIADSGGATQAVRSASPLLARLPAPLVTAIVTNQAGVDQLMPPLVQSTTGNSELALAVPPGQPYTITVRSSLLNLADASGKPLPRNMFQVSFTSPAADPRYVPPSFMGHRVGPDAPSRVFDFTVTGPFVQ